MKLNQIFEDEHHPTDYKQWQKDCRKVCPDCQFTGSPMMGAQAVMWNDKNNPVIGEWDRRTMTGTVTAVK
jgi:hypothetical protein